MIQQQYKYFLPALLLSFSLYISDSFANILDGGEIQFSGFVTDEAPKWTWQIGAPEQRWEVNIADARSENGWLIFDLKDKGRFAFLEGHLHEVAERGGPGFIPLMAFSSNGQPLTINKGVSTAQQFRASVPVRNSDSGDVTGQLSFTLTQGMAVSVGEQEEIHSIPTGMSLVSGQSVTNVESTTLPRELKNRLSTLLLMNQGGGGYISSVDNGQVINQAALTDGRVMNLAASYASDVSDFELKLPVDKPPERWQASLNVIVTVQ